jgi:serine phosphatase RsbU (regulator of sigma subunit)
MLTVLALGVVLIGVRIASVLREGATLQKDIKLLMAGEYVPDSEKRIQTMKRQGISLRIKFVLLITSLVLMVVVITATWLSYQVISRQERALAEGLDSQLNVLLEGLEAQTPGAFADRAETLAQIEFLEILGLRGSLAGPTTSLTIVGEPVFAPGDIEYDKVYATDDPELREVFEYGVTAFESSLFESEFVYEGQTVDVQAFADLIDERSNGENEAALARIGELQAQANAAATFEEAREFIDAQQELEAQINAGLSEIANAFTVSVPTFNTIDFDPDTTEYEYYRPILNLDDDGRTFRGFIVLGFQTEDIRAEIQAAQRDLIRTSLFIAAIAGGLGLLGALLLSAIIIRPIQALVRGVEVIRDEEDKEALEGHVISIRTRDEIQSLAETVNEMTVGLVKAAKANKELTLGKDVQKKFVPLETDLTGRKLTTVHKELPNVEFFGYYEGAKGVSGDYFTFRQIPIAGDYWAFIKCDVAGKGIPAALIMVQVATMFENHFRDWDQRRGTNFRVTDLVNDINDILNLIGFPGRFAALTIGVYDAQSGKAQVSHAGDNILNVYRAASRSLETVKFEETPAAGVFTSDLFPPGREYRLYEVALQPGDFMLLYTDGMEEAQRYLRDSDFNIIKCDEPDLEPPQFEHKVNPGDEAGTHVKGADSEELTPDRVRQIVHEYFRRGSYTLKKLHDPRPDEPMEFDFSGTTGSMREAIVALMSVEKVFRLNQDPKSIAGQRIVMDRQIHEFLQDHFVQCSRYYAKVSDHPNEEYVYINDILEDDQYDDLTVLGIKRV